jgi:hypothetical protein
MHVSANARSGARVTNASRTDSINAGTRCTIALRSAKRCVCGNVAPSKAAGNAPSTATVIGLVHECHDRRFARDCCQPVLSPQREYLVQHLARAIESANNYNAQKKRATFGQTFDCASTAALVTAFRKRTAQEP